MKILLICIFMATFSSAIFAENTSENFSENIDELWSIPDWSDQSSLPSTGEENRANLYQLNQQELETANRNGRLQSLWYPVEVTGLKVPYRPIESLTTPGKNPFKTLVLKLVDKLFDFSTPDDLYRAMGLKKYPSTENEGVFFVPFLNNKKPNVRMGITIVDSEKGKYVTASCTACHAESLFGKPVIGLTNKTPRANAIFELASAITPKISPTLIKVLTKSSNEEVLLWREMQDTFHWIGVKKPQVLGLDTSLATVSLSLSKRELDPYANITKHAYLNPRPNSLATLVSDSKPMPWFTLKYKTRWLSDGSVVSGNPIFTNFLWNEVGRGVDLNQMEKWLDLKSTKKMIIELTAAIFATEAPRYTDFFPSSSINLESAKKGQELFNHTCQKCHGTYDKAWDSENASRLSHEELLVTTKVHYFKTTQVKDVGTDPNRYLAMKILAPDLNRLSISQKMGVKVIPQTGYVPPPLIGIWSRWPYFHNNSAPTLCDVISKPFERSKRWYIGEPVDPNTDFDQECNGFPKMEKAPRHWKTADRLFDVSRPGMTNLGHYKIDYSFQEKKDLISFLKTL